MYKWIGGVNNFEYYHHFHSRTAIRRGQMNGIRRSVLQKNKLLRQLCPQYERPPKPSFPTETFEQQSFWSELTKNEKIAKCAFTPFYHDTEFEFWFDEVQHFFIQNNYCTTLDSLRLSELPEAIKSWRHKIYYTFPSLQNDMFSFNYKFLFFQYLMLSWD